MDNKILKHNEFVKKEYEKYHKENIKNVNNFDILKSDTFCESILTTDYFSILEKKQIRKFLQLNEWKDIFNDKILNESLLIEKNFINGIKDKLNNLFSNIKEFTTNIINGINAIYKQQLTSIKKTIEVDAKKVIDEIKNKKVQFDKEYAKVESQWWKDLVKYLTVDTFNLFKEYLISAFTKSAKESVSEGISKFGMDYYYMIFENKKDVKKSKSKEIYNFIKEKIHNNIAYKKIIELLNKLNSIVHIMDNFIADNINKGLDKISDIFNDLTNAPNKPSDGFKVSGIVLNVMLQLGLLVTTDINIWSLTWQKIALTLGKKMLTHGIPGYTIIYTIIKLAKYGLVAEHSLHLLNIHIGKSHSNHH